jgi:hypothetical protein
MNQEDLDNSPQVPGRSTIGSIKLVDVNGDGVITRGGEKMTEQLLATRSLF